MPIGRYRLHTGKNEWNHCFNCSFTWWVKIKLQNTTTIILGFFMTLRQTEKLYKTAHHSRCKQLLMKQKIFQGVCWRGTHSISVNKLWIYIYRCSHTSIIIVKPFWAWLPILFVHYSSRFSRTVSSVFDSVPNGLTLFHRKTN